MKTKQSSSAVGPADKVQKTVDFSNKELYVGIDVHKTRWQAAVFLEGVVLSNVSIAACADGLIAYLHKYYGNAAFHCVYECGAFGFTLCRALWAAGMQCIVVNPADIPGTDRERRSKTDVIDARKLARHHGSRTTARCACTERKITKAKKHHPLQKETMGRPGKS